MNILKKLLIFIAGSTLSFVLYSTASLWIFNQTIFNPATLKNWINDSGLYTNIIPAIVEVADNPSTKSTVPLKDNTIVDAGKKAFNETVLKSATEQGIDQATMWLDGKTSTLQFNIDFSGARADFAKGIGAVAEARLAGLPPCGVKIPEDFDAFSVACLPKTVSAKSEGDKLAAELTKSSDFLGTGVLSSKTLQLDTPGKELPKEVPQLYQARNDAFYLGIVVSGILVAILIFARTDKRRGLRVVCHTGIVVAVSLLTVGLLFPALSKSINPSTDSTADKVFVDKIVLPLVKQGAKGMGSSYVIAGSVIGALSVAGYVGLFITKQKKTEQQIVDRHNIDKPAA